MKKKKILQVCLAVCMLLWGSSLQALAVTVINVGHAMPETDSVHLAWLFFKEKVEARSKGSLLVEISANGASGSEQELAEAVKRGELAGTTVTNSSFAPFVKDFYILDVPFVFSARSDVWKALDGDLGKALSRSAEKNGFVILAYMESGFRNITNNKLPIRNLKDLSGLIVQTMENPVHVAVWEAVGVKPVAVPSNAFEAVHAALQQGTADGQEGPDVLTYKHKYNEVQKYMSDTQHLFTVYVGIMNKEFFESLHWQEQRLLVAVNDEMQTYQRELAVKSAEEVRTAMLASGMEITTLKPEERNALKTVVPVAMRVAEQLVAKDIVALFRKNVLK